MDEKHSEQPDISGEGGSRFRLKMAGICADVTALYPEAGKMCRDYIADDLPCDFEIVTTEKDIDREEMSSFATDIAEGRKPVRYRRGYLETLAIYRQFCDAADAVLSGVESRTSSPLRILRDEAGLSNIAGIYPCGGGAGYAGGITSAAMDGMAAAERIASRYRRFS